MSIPDTVETIAINIDGVDVQVPKGINAIEAAKLHGKEVPHYCYHPKLSIAGNCRMCLIEMGMPMRDRATGDPVMDTNGEQKIGWSPKPTIGCSTNVSPGMHLRTNSTMVKEARNGVTEFLLINHPLDCPICDQAGECRLQEFSADHGRGVSRFIEDKNVKPKRTRLGPRVTLDDERCILCSRCIRFSQEVAKDDVLGFVDRGTYSTLTCYPGKELANNYSLNTVDICPVGALTSTDFRFKMRVWFLKRTNSICTESSVGSNTTVWSREGKIYRITPRQNDATNDTWMTDSGRGLFKETESENRINDYTIDGVSEDMEIVAQTAADLLQQGKVALVGSAHSSVEEQFYLKKISEYASASTNIIAKTGDGDGILLSEDRTPNLRGALLNRLITELPNAAADSIDSQIQSGAIQTLFVVNEDLTSLGISQESLAKVSIIYFGSLANQTSKVATVVIPTLTVFEKSGSLVNQNFILQQFLPAIPGPKGVISDVLMLAKIVEKMTGDTIEPVTLTMIWQELSNTIAEFKSITWQKIGDEQGIQINPRAFLDLPFVESKNLKFDPTAFKEANSTALES
ncbi:MAG: ferredoxin [Puniceicoccaceae bacterium MED-G31]|nr:MAG: ferredoxin [Puniceicoccaceae bacterium MED-G31]